MVLNEIIREDLDYVASKICELEFRNSSIMITGSTGLIGSNIVKSFLWANRLFNLKNKVYAFSRDYLKAKAIFEDFSDSYLYIIEGDINKPLNLSDKVDYVIHAASYTSSYDMVTKPVEVINTIVNGTNNVLDYSKRYEIKNTIFLSSLEVYGIIEEDNKEIRETDLGFIDNLKIRSSYSEGKRMAECLSIAYNSEYKVNVVVARLTQTFGPGIKDNDNRIFAQIIRSVKSGTDIVLNSTGELKRNYCYLFDSITGIITLLKKGKPGEAYNIANKETYISIYEMANFVAKEIAKGEIKVVINIPINDSAYGYSPVTKLKLNCNKIEDLGWEARFGLKEMFLRTLATF